MPFKGPFKIRLAQLITNLFAKNCTSYVLQIMKIFRKKKANQKG